MPEIATTGYAVRFAKVNAAAKISNTTGALTFFTDANHASDTYLYLGIGSNSIPIAARSADTAGAVASPLTFVTTSGDAAGSWYGNATKNVGYATVGALAANGVAKKAEALSYANGTLRNAGSQYTANNASTGRPVYFLNGVPTVINTVGSAYQADVAKKVSCAVTFTTNSGDTSTTGVSYDGSAIKNIGYATVGALGVNSTAQAALKLVNTTGTAYSVGSQYTANNASTGRPVYFSGGIPVVINTVGSAYQADVSKKTQKTLTFTNYKNATATAISPSFNGSADVSVDIGANIIIATFTMASGNTTIAISSKDITSASNMRVISTVITEGAENMTSAFTVGDFTAATNTANGSVTLTCSAVTGNVTGYIVLARSAEVVAATVSGGS